MDFSAKGTTKDAACLRRRRSCTPPLLLDSTSNQSMVDLEAVRATVSALIAVARHRFTQIRAVQRVLTATSGRVTVPTTLVVNSSAAATCTHGHGARRTPL